MPLRTLWRDLSQAARRLRRSPTYAIFSIVTLGLGIGVAAAAYSAMYVLALRSSGLDDRNLAVLGRSNSPTPNAPALVSRQDLQALAQQQSTFPVVAAWVRVPTVALVGPRSSAFVDVEAVTGDYFAMVGLRAAHGRLIQRADDEPGAAHVLVLSEPAWHQHFEGDPGAIGRTVRLGGRPVEIIGVAPAGFRGLTAVFAGQYAGWVPASFLQSSADPVWQAWATRSTLNVGARLREGVSLESASLEVTTIGQRLDTFDPLPPIRLANPDAAPVARVRAWTLFRAGDLAISSTAREMARAVVTLPVLVLLVACTNLANLVLSRGASRRHECGVRAALGASRWRLIREQIAEMSIVAAAGGLLGVGVAHALLTWTVASLREPLLALAPQSLVEWRLEPVVFAAAGAAALMAMVVAGVLPALQVTRTAVGRLLTTDPVGAMPRWRGRSNLVALQVGVSVALFLIAVVCVRFIVSRPARASIDPGVGLERLVAATVPFRLQMYDEARTRQTLDAIVQDLRRSPGVERVALAFGLPIAAPWLRVFGPFGYATTPDRPFVPREYSGERAQIVAASPEVFATFDLRPAAGRFYDQRDVATGERVVVLDQRLATELFGAPAGVGRQVLLQLYGETSRTPDLVTATVIGITAPGPLDQQRGRLGVAYLPLAQYEPTTVSIVARSRTDDSRPLVGVVREAIRRADPSLALRHAGRLDVMAGGPFRFLGFIATAAGFLATLALALAMAGLYGVLSHIVSKRMRELGLRVALGAEPGQIAWLIFRSGFRPVVEGLAIGLGSALVIRQLLQAQFTEPLSGIDTAMFALAAVPLVLAGALACSLPAARASRVDPNIVLREL